MSTIGSKRGIIRQNLLRGPKARGGMRLFLNYSTLLYLFNLKDASLLGPLVTYSTHLLLCFASKAMSNRNCQTIHLYHCISKQRILFKHRLSHLFDYWIYQFSSCTWTMPIYFLHNLNSEEETDTVYMS